MAPSPQESECTQPMKTWTGCWFEDFSVGDELVTAGAGAFYNARIRRRYDPR